MRLRLRMLTLVLLWFVNTWPLPVSYAGFDLAPVAISNDPLMLADLPQICYCQKSPFSSVYFSTHDRLLCAGNLSQLGCPQFILSQHVYLSAHVGHPFSFGVTLSVPTFTMFDSALH